MKKGKKIVYSILIIILLVGSSVGYYFFYENEHYFTTDNAKITAKMYTLTPLTTGKLLEWNVADGKVVKKDQVLGHQSTSSYINSPINGTVVKNNVTEDQMVGPSTQLATIADTANLYVGVNIEETDIAKIAIGQTVDVNIDAYPHVTFKGKIESMDASTQTFMSGTSSLTTSGTYTKVTQLVPVKVVIENPNYYPLILGMNATVKVHIK
jgi:multidrug resistance efflux pump